MSLNVSVLMGRLVRDPELRHTSNGISVTSFTLAVDRDYCPKGQERQADFIDVVAWHKTAEFVCTYFGKGKMVAIQGPIQTRTYTDKSLPSRGVWIEIIGGEAFCCLIPVAPLAGSVD